MLFQNWSGFFWCFLAKSNLVLFAPCGEPFVFALVKSSLDCRLYQWHAYLLESVLLLAGCCERVFLYHGEDSRIIHHCCPPWTSRPFYVAKLTSVFCFSHNVPNIDLATPNVLAVSLMDLLFLKTNNCLFHLYGEMTTWCGFTATASKCKWHTYNSNSNPDLLPA